MGYLLCGCQISEHLAACRQESDAFSYKVNKKVERIAHFYEKN